MSVHSLKLWLLLVSASLFVVSCSKKSTPLIDPPNPAEEIIKDPPALGFSVIGYFPNYKTVAEYPDRFFKMCTIINYAFFNVTPGGTIDVVNKTKFDSVYTKAKTNGAKVFISIGGDGAANFKSMAATATSRTIFITDVMKKVRSLQVDGVDMDWEYPRSDDGTDETFSLLMKQLSDSLHKGGRYYLSAAITPGKYTGAIRDGIRNTLFSFVDFFNVMAYDDFSTTAPFRHHSDIALSNLTFNYWTNLRGMPKHKFILGIPAYGRPSGITQSGTVLSYKAILEKGGNPASDSAVVSNGSFTNYTIYYNGTNTVKTKALDAKATAGGIMFWEIGHDSPTDFSLIKAACDAVGRTY